ncbi:hypothetical protein GA0116948_106157 [Chitinophaga costaii]|uniref:Uncharacterized protein n=1 Tax=Chitinophaga costaii TaxID=1335309 RepID=A0A1C4DW69_9BACT|nr:hypothetical protein [Chitinophaga costaii]PUZ27835.1 hypothetical protein DCM91_06410 [Chitinophaga costaii]SCC35634.1 hypothetical protein GA0116948_106157 [Chitinophaga costaii]
MRKTIVIILLAGLDIFIACSCRSNKVGCPQPRSQWGAEKVLDEMSKPKKGGKSTHATGQAG